MPKKELKGVVISAGKMRKTIKVLVETIVQHPKYKKYIKKRKKYLVHDENEIAREGDIVLIRESRPISKLKHFYLVKILERRGGEKKEGEENKGEKVEQKQVEV